MKSFDLVEEFIILKSTFLLLQILFELRKCNPAWPIINFIEHRLKKSEEIIQLKQKIWTKDEEVQKDMLNQT